MYQIACIGFIEAIQRFNFKFDVELSTYSVQYMIGEIKKFLRDDGIIRISRNLKKIGIKASQIVESINEKIDDGGKELVEVLAKDEDEQMKIIDKITVLELLEELNYRDRELISLRYFKDKTQAQVANILGISQVHVSRIEKRILKDFKSKLLA